MVSRSDWHAQVYQALLVQGLQGCLAYILHSHAPGSASLAADNELRLSQLPVLCLTWEKPELSNGPSIDFLDLQAEMRNAQAAMKYRD